MATTITRTVKVSGGDYTTITAWESAEQDNITAAGSDEIHICECYKGFSNDFTNGLYDEVTISGWTTDSTHYIVIRTPMSERHCGRMWVGSSTGSGGTASGFTLCPNANVTSAFSILEDYTRVEGINLFNGRAKTITNGFNLTTSCVIDSCIVECLDGTKDINNGISLNGSSAYAVNCTVYEAGARGFEVSAAAAGTSATYCCTSVDATVTGFFGGATGTNDAYNCLADNSGTNDFGTGMDTLYYCASSDTSAGSSNGCRSSQTFTFQDATNFDYHLASTDAGARTYGNYYAGPAIAGVTGDDYIERDADGGLRPASGETADWDIGADQYTKCDAKTFTVKASGGDATSLNGLSWQDCFAGPRAANTDVTIEFYQGDYTGNGYSGSSNNTGVDDSTIINANVSESSSIDDWWFFSISNQQQLTTKFTNAEGISGILGDTDYYYHSSWFSFDTDTNFGMEIAFEDFSFTTYITAIRGTSSNGLLRLERVTLDSSGVSNDSLHIGCYTVKVINSIIKCKSSGASCIKRYSTNNNVLIVYNSTLIDGDYSIEELGTVTEHLKNILFYSPNTYPIHSSQAYNLTNCATDASAFDASSHASETSCRKSQTFTFVAAGSDDYHLSSSDAGAKGYGIDLSSDGQHSFSDDIDGDTRS